jgi:hypothetical protein
MRVLPFSDADSLKAIDAQATSVQVSESSTQNVDVIAIR